MNTHTDIAADIDHHNLSERFVTIDYIKIGSKKNNIETMAWMINAASAASAAESVSEYVVAETKQVMLSNLSKMQSCYDTNVAYTEYSDCIRSIISSLDQFSNDILPSHQQHLLNLRIGSLSKTIVRFIHQIVSRTCINHANKQLQMDIVHLIKMEKQQQHMNRLSNHISNNIHDNDYDDETTEYCRKQYEFLKSVYDNNNDAQEYHNVYEQHHLEQLQLKYGIYQFRSFLMQEMIYQQQQTCEEPDSQHQHYQQNLAYIVSLDYRITQDLIYFVVSRISSSSSGILYVQQNWNIMFNEMLLLLYRLYGDYLTDVLKLRCCSCDCVQTTSQTFVRSSNTTNTHNEKLKNALICIMNQYNTKQIKSDHSNSSSNFHQKISIINSNNAIIKAIRQFFQNIICFCKNMFIETDTDTTNLIPPPPPLTLNYTNKHTTKTINVYYALKYSIMTEYDRRLSYTRQIVENISSVYNDDNLQERINMCAGMFTQQASSSTLNNNANNALYVIENIVASSEIETDWLLSKLWKHAASATFATDDQSFNRNKSNITTKKNRRWFKKFCKKCDYYLLGFSTNRDDGAPSMPDKEEHDSSAAVANNSTSTQISQQQHRFKYYITNQKFITNFFIISRKHI